MSYEMKIVSVDDNAINLLLVETLAQDIGYSVISFESAIKAIEYVHENPVDIVLTDYMMPEMHGIELISQIRKDFHDIPIVMITAVTDNNKLRIDALEAGATEFLNKPLNPPEFKARLTSLINLRNAQLMLQSRALHLETEVNKAVCLVEARERETLNVLSRVAEYKDPNTAGHINRVASYSAVILRALGGNIYDQEILFHAAPLHDVGKIGIPDHILLKPGKYTEEEFEIMKKHTVIGYEMVKEASSPYLRMGGEIALTHHEKFNGMGYPYGLKTEQIPLAGRILAVADVFDALTSKRPYKDKWDIKDALDLLQAERGRHFDPRLVDIFMDNLEDVYTIYSAQRHSQIDFHAYFNHGERSASFE
ncbi:MAG: response regulator [Deferribacteraceae bacterium]|jgi:putative two-component system response regulator|nr:response regulator [Deferribacteraceae bacterium]